MTRTLTIRASLIVLSGLSLAACATPDYPTRASATPTPTRAPAANPTPTAPPPRAAPPPAATPAPPAPAPVESQPLPPVTAPSQPPAPSPAQSALAPDYVPPSPGAAESLPPPPPPRAPPPEAYQAPEVRYKPGPERVVAGGRVVAATGMFRDYTVRPHDHVDAIARDLQTTRKVLVEANRLKAPFGLQPGQHLKVPVAKAYEAQAGDTMTDVAKRFGVSAAELADLNDLPVRGRLRSGDKLALPDDFHDRGPTRLPPVMVAERTPESRATYESRPAPAPAPARRVQAEEPTGGPYVPSPEALAAAQRLAVTRSYASPSYAPRSGSAAASTTETAEPQGPPTGAQLAIANAGRGRFIWPVRGDIISPFGVKGVGRRNDGIDVRSPEGTAVHAAAAGEVVYAGNQVPGFGNLVLVKHADGWVTAYAHLQSIGVTMRETVVQGQMLGDVGATGGVGEAQLHFEIRYASTPAEKAKPVDPLLVLPK